LGKNFKNRKGGDYFDSHCTQQHWMWMTGQAVYLTESLHFFEPCSDVYVHRH